MVAPKYIALANEVRKEVLSGRYGPEGGLPAISEIAKKHSVVVNTVKVALSRLEGEGLIIQRGQNYYVNSLEILMTRHVELPTTRLRPRGGYVKTLHIGRAHIPEYVAHKLRVSPATREVLTRDQVAGEMNGRERPLQLTHRYYFLALSDDQVKRLEQEAGWDPLWDITSVLLSRDEICARPATTQEAGLLDLPEGTAVLTVWEVIRDTKDGTLLMAQDITLSPRETLIFEFPFENKPA